MWNIRRALLGVALISSAMCAGCAFPLNHDVPHDKYNQPTVKTIVQRIQCEIRDMVRDDRPNDPASFHRLFLLNGDYDVVVALSLETTNGGGLAPSVTYVSPLEKVATTFTFSGSATLSEELTDGFTSNIELSTRQIYVDWKRGDNSYDCPDADTNLAGSLGLKNIVSMAASAPNLDEKLKSKASSVFGGTRQFVVTKKLTSVGPSWQLILFTNIAALTNFSDVHTDKITLGFAPGPNKGKRLNLGKRIPPPTVMNRAAYQLVQQQILNSISTQLVIQNQR